MRSRLLYVYEERIPAGLQELVLSYFGTDEFEVRKMSYAETESEKEEKLAWAEVAFFAPGRFLDDKLLRRAAHMKLMQLWSSGYDKFNTKGAAALGIPVANNGGGNAPSVAEHAILLMLACYKWLPASHHRTVTGSWAGNSHGLDMFTLSGKRVGIIGLGNIGRRVAKIASAFGASVCYFDVIRPPKDVEQETSASFVPFEDLMAQSDVITLHLHLNERTRHIIGRNELARMKPSALFINVSRAGLVDSGALLVALREGRLAGVGLDVYDDEPTHPQDPLLCHPRVVCTPHIAGSTIDAYRLALGNAVENFRRVKRGERPRWVINGVER